MDPFLFAPHPAKAPAETPKMPVTRYRRRDWFACDALPLHVGTACIEGNYNRHDHDWMEIVLILGGSGRHIWGEGEKPIGEGSAFVLRPGVWHGYEECYGLQTLTLSFGLELLTDELRLIERDAAISYLLWTGPLAPERRGLITLQLPDPALQKCQNHLQNLGTFRREGRLTSRVAQVGHLLLFLHHLAANLGAEHQAPMQARGPMHPAVRECARLLEEKPASAWTLDDLAHHVHLDRCYLTRIFKNELGVAPLNYLSRLRAERAAVLLLRSNASISDVGQLVGWNDPSYFAQRFKAHFGMTAKAYRAERAANPAQSQSRTPNDEDEA